MLGKCLWDSSWASGIIVFDSDIDAEYAQSLVVPQSPEQVEWSESTLDFPSFALNAGDPSTFTVQLPGSLFRKIGERLKILINKYLWNETESLYYDYDVVKKSQTTYKSVTATWALWSGVASKEQAAVLVPRCLELFEVVGGLVSGTLESRGPLGPDRPSRQWDYPYGNRYTHFSICGKILNP
jgi:hypothetical protein